uniref:C-24(28) sterol reductase n=1 Tax=Ganoderma boninense TaxID=34458 RepID=A0A5K1K2N4_9APHY|nr:C-24(28) sterol reductase [Ganoderma boninense]
MGFDLLPLDDTPDANTAIEGRHLPCYFSPSLAPALSSIPPSFSLRPPPAHNPPAFSMIDTLPVDISSFPDSLSSYNVHQLQFALSQESKPAETQPLTFDARLLYAPFSSLRLLRDLPLTPNPAEIDYDSRRMSSSATSDSSLHSRPDKRPATPDHSPVPKRPRPGLDSPWSDPDTPDVPPSGLPAPLDNDSSGADLDSARVQLPSLASTFNDRHELRRASLPALYSDSPSRPRLPYPIHRTTQSSSSGLSSYQFPASDSADPDAKPTRPRLEADTQLGVYSGPVSDNLSSLSSAALSSNSPSSFGFSPLSSSEFSAPSSRPTLSPSGLSDPDSWAAASIARPSSTPGSAQKYDDSLRHSSIPGPQSMFGGVQRISGHSDRSPVSRLGAQNGNGLSSIKTENDWTFPNGSPDFNMNSSTSASALAAGAGPGSNPAISVTNSPNRSPQAVPTSANPSGLVDRPPQRKRGKLPKPVTDFLKDWLHRHSDHPYPSEEEKKQLCHATGLSMSQVSNWMINARRRILAPARHSTAGPTTTTPFATRTGAVGMGMGMPGMGGLGAPAIDPSRRMSVDSLQLYYPMSLQSLAHEPHGHHLNPPSTRHMVGMSRSLSSSHATAGNLSGLGHHGHGHSPYALSDSSYAQGRLSYGGSGGHALHPSAHSSHHSSSSGFFGMGGSGGSNSSGFLGPQGSMYSGGGGYAQSGSHHAPQGGSPGGRVLTPGTDESVQASYRFPEHSASPGPQSGSGYATPQ